VDRGLLVRALTHRSWIEEQYPGHGAAFAHEGQERLEFLGDAFLGYVVARALFDAQEMAGEGDLTVSRAGKVSREALTEIGKRLEVVRYLRLGVGERLKAGENKNLAADTVEAIVGAVLVDAGEVRAREVVLGLVGEAVAGSEAGAGVADDVISRANLYCTQSSGHKGRIPAPL
jgi:dsRNA-specific ribonuclease